MPVVEWKLHKVMGAKRLKIADVARMADLAWETVSNIYHGRSSMVSLETIEALCTALDCQPGDLFEYVRGKEKPGK